MVVLMRVIRIPYLILAVTLIAASHVSAAPTAYSLDGIVLGSTIDDAVSALGKPNTSSGTKYEWINLGAGLSRLDHSGSGRHLEDCGKGGLLGSGQSAHADSVSQCHRVMLLRFHRMAD